MRIALAAALLASGVGGCHTTRTPDLPDPDVDLGLGDVVLLTFTTRAPEGLLGHVLTAGAKLGEGLDPHRKPISGKPREVNTAQHLRLVLRVEDKLGVGGRYGPAKAQAEATRATHVAYDVTLTSYLEYAPIELLYDPSSGCCVGGARTEACGAYYVTRLFRGTGSTQLLSELSGSASIHAADILHASGGRSFRKLSESEFTDAYFGYELASLDSLCARLEPEQEMPALRVEAPKNCFLTRYTGDGARHQNAWTLPDRDLCALVLEKACKDSGDSVRCEGRFHDRVDTQAAGPVTAAPMTQQPEHFEIIPLAPPGAADREEPSSPPK